MQQFAADVQGQVGRIHHAFDEAQIHGHQGLGVVHDEDAFDIEFQACFFIAVEQVHRCLGGDVQQLGVLGAAFDAVVAPSQWGFKVVADVFVELGVLLRRDVFLGTRPQRIGLVDGFPLVDDDHLAGLVVFAFFPLFFAHTNGQRDVIRVFVDDGFELPVAEVFLSIVAQMQDDVRAAIRLGDGFNLELARARAAPAHTFFGLEARAARFHGDAVGHDVARIKAHAELADQGALVFGVGFLVAAQFAHELARAAFGDGAQVVNRLLLAHANAVVRNGECFGCFVKTHAHF